MIKQLVLPFLLTLGSIQLHASDKVPAGTAHADAPAAGGVAGAPVAEGKGDADRKAAMNSRSAHEADSKRELNPAEYERIRTLLRGPTKDLRAALDKREFSINQWLGNAPFLTFALYWGASPATVALLLDRGADIEDRYETNTTPVFALFLNQYNHRPTTRKAIYLRILFVAGANFSPYVDSGEDLLHSNALTYKRNAEKYIDALIVLGCNREARMATMGEQMTPFELLVYLCIPGRNRSIQSLVACGADTSRADYFIEHGCNRGEPHEQYVRDQIKKGELTATKRQLPQVIQQLQSTFHGNDGYVRVLGTDLAPLINAYTGPLILPRRKYTHAEKLAVLDRLVVLEAQEARAERMLTKAIKRFKTRKAAKAGAKPA
jgi:hypothetical protein